MPKCISKCLYINFQDTEKSCYNTNVVKKFFSTVKHKMGLSELIMLEESYRALVNVGAAAPTDFEID